MFLGSATKVPLYGRIKVRRINVASKRLKAYLFYLKLFEKNEILRYDRYKV